MNVQTSLAACSARAWRRVWLDTHLPQARGQAERSIELSNELGWIRAGIATHRGIEPRVLVTHVIAIEVQDRGEQDCVQGPVMQPEGLIGSAGVAHGVD